MESFLEAPIVTLSVGPSEGKFYIHARVWQSLTPFLGLFGPIEGESGVFRIQESVADIFGQVCDYLYTGDYSAGVLKYVHSEKKDTAHNYSPCHCGVDGQSCPQFEGNATINERIVFAESSGLNPPTCGRQHSTCKPYDALILHLKVGIFARKHNMLLLSVRSLGNLLNALIDLSLKEDEINEIVRLFRLLLQSGNGAVNYL